MPASESTSIRVPSELREQVERYGRERRWTFGETARVALEQLVDYKPEPEPERTAP